MHRYVELIIVLVAVLTPQFLLASEVSGDEFSKATTGIGLAAVVLGAYRAWTSVREMPS